MTTATPDTAHDSRLAALEAEHAEELARAHAALAAAQDRLYWLDRWGLDLNALMRRRGASELRMALRALRFVAHTGLRAKAGAAHVPGRVRRARKRR